MDWRQFPTRLPRRTCCIYSRKLMADSRKGKHMDGGMALILVAFGLPGAIWPHKVARFEEQMDSIGSKRSWSEVEPAGWKVVLTRAIGVGMVLAGLLGLLAG